MGSILARRRSDGTVGYTAQIVRKRGKEFLHREAKTFDKEREAKAWLRWREAQLDRPGGLTPVPKATLAEAIDRYLKETTKAPGKTKAQVLRTIKTLPLAAMDSAAIGSEDIVAFAQGLLEGGRQPQTVNNYLSHLASIFDIAKPAWGIPLDKEKFKAALVVLRRLGTTSKSKKRDRRPTLAELDRVLIHFTERQARAPDSAPMVKIALFALFSTRRQEEITRLLWADLDERHSRILIRDMKHPGQKLGNDVYVDLPPEALAVIKSMPRTGDRIFPFSTDAISAAFTRACHVLGIDDLHFHDLRHEGVSRLFEMGRTIPQAASVSGHRSWQSLQRYAHLRETGDKYIGWRWLPKVDP
ncbi:site-specific integrase [Ancylobacter sonchi]|uniref:tyrosine-type recombinase/integrase n=1 Tax=Ancylobacter sonchi TaxID=1937790 RepID=UPI001BD5274B|nr:site-specific integrase [Ancylobacter sonchi]MBS7535045.1 site-specific integrase [Ancylobacter sonchi]